MKISDEDLSLKLQAESWKLKAKRLEDERWEVEFEDKRKENFICKLNLWKRVVLKIYDFG